jgi:hypothetical protein
MFMLTALDLYDTFDPDTVAASSAFESSEVVPAIGSEERTECPEGGVVLSTCAWSRPLEEDERESVESEVGSEVWIAG